MRRTVHIRRYKELAKTVFYTVHFEGEEQNETDKFLLRHEANQALKEDLGIIVEYIKKIGQETGALERYFRPEKRAKALPIYACKLRLYCVRCSDSVVILGNGGIKTAQTVQECPDLLPHFKTMNKVAALYKNRLRTGEISLKQKSLTGNLKFRI